MYEHVCGKKEKVPGVDGKSESIDRCEIQWNSFGEVWNLSGALGKGLSEETLGNSKVELKTTKEEGKKHSLAVKITEKQCHSMH